MPRTRHGDDLADDLCRAAVASRIKTARKQAGMTQTQLAERLHVHWRTVQEWETPRSHSVPFDRLDELGEATGQSRDWFLMGGLDEGRLTEVERRLDALEEIVAVLVRRQRVN